MGVKSLVQGLNAAAVCTATKDMNFKSFINQKKKIRREGERCSIPMPVFNESLVFDMASMSEQIAPFPYI